MSWTMRHEVEEATLWITTEGVHTLRDVQQLTLEALAEAKRYDVQKFLVDDRRMTPAFGTLDIYKLPREILRLGVDRGMQIAVVFSGVSPKKEDFKFFETTAGNFGGAEVRLFEDSMEKAQEWLGWSRKNS